MPHRCTVQGPEDSWREEASPCWISGTYSMLLIVFLSIWLFICVSVYLFVCLCVYLSIWLSVCLSVWSCTWFIDEFTLLFILIISSFFTHLSNLIIKFLTCLLSIIITIFRSCQSLSYSIPCYLILFATDMSYICLLFYTFEPFLYFIDSLLYSLV